MGSLRKIYEAVISGRSDSNLRFGDVCRLLRSAGFAERIKGGHHIFSHVGVIEIINLQPLNGGGAKAYQVKQVRGIFAKYGLSPR